ncbi:hypothetical protein EDC04DRAFT_2586763, partial [Pisolithus marmoratus]
VGILCRAGSGKSTLALSYLRTVERTEGRDDVNIFKIALTNMRRMLAIPTYIPAILDGTLRSANTAIDL